MLFFFKQKTAYEIYQCDWSSDVCSSDLKSGFFLSCVMLTVGFAAGCGQVPTPAPDEVTIGALLPLTGNLSSVGEASQAAIELAVADVNAYLAGLESTRRIRLVVEDTKTEPAEALEKLKQLREKGIGLIVGPMSSDEVSACKAYADRVGALLVSPSSTAPTLAVEDDYVFRFVPNDIGQADAIAQRMQQDGIAAIAFLRRDGLWGSELSDLTAERFADAGGTVVGSVEYSPSELTSSDFRTELEELSTIVGRAIEDFGVANVAVQLVSFGEGVQVFKQAASDAVLSSVPWYGTDGFVLHRNLVQDSQAAAFAMTVGYVAPIFAESDSERFMTVHAEIEQAIGRQPDTYALVAYDVVWAAALTINLIEEEFSLKMCKKVANIAGGVPERGTVEID